MGIAAAAEGVMRSFLDTPRSGLYGPPVLEALCIAGSWVARFYEQVTSIVILPFFHYTMGMIQHRKPGHPKFERRPNGGGGRGEQHTGTAGANGSSAQVSRAKPANIGL